MVLATFPQWQHLQVFELEWGVGVGVGEWNWRVELELESGVSGNDQDKRSARGADPGIILVARLLVSRAGGLPSPRSPTYQQAETKMKSERENFRCFLLLLFLFRRAETVEIRHGTVVAYDLRTRPCSRPLAHGHFGRLGASASPSRRVHHSLTCRSAKLAVERTGNDLATRVGAPRVHQRGADSPMPERMVII